MANIDNITKGIAVGPVGGFTTDNGTLDVQTGNFGTMTKSNGLTDGTSIATASKNMAELYNRVLLDAASALDLACNLGDPAMVGSIDDLLPASAIDARDIEKNWAPITTLGYILGEGIKSVRAQAVAAQTTANQAVAATGGYSFTGSIQFVKATNRIIATGIGAGCEVGDVVKVTGTVQNNKLFTVDSIVDANTVAVNEAHKNGAGTLSLNNETVTSTVMLLVKWHSAASGLGQAWIDVTSQIVDNVNRVNTAGREIQVTLYGGPVTGPVSMLYIDDILAGKWGGGEPDDCSFTFTLDRGGRYRVVNLPTAYDPHPPAGILFYVLEKR